MTYENQGLSTNLLCEFGPIWLNTCSDMSWPLFMPRSYICTWPHMIFPYPAACFGSYRPYWTLPIVISMAHMWSHILRPSRRCPVNIGRVKMQGSHNGAGRMPASKPTGSVPMNRCTPWLPGPSQGLQGARLGAVRCTELCVLWHLRLLYLKLHSTLRFDRIRPEGPTGSFRAFYALTVRLKRQEKLGAANSAPRPPFIWWNTCSDISFAFLTKLLMEK